jgi:hypothetical protein
MTGIGCGGEPVKAKGKSKKQKFYLLPRPRDAKMAFADPRWNEISLRPGLNHPDKILTF